MQEETDLGPRKTFSRNLAIKIIKESGIKSPPISLGTIVRQLQSKLNLQLQKVSFEDVSGILIQCQDNEKETNIIAFNENDSWVRRRFTIAHEIGHLLMFHNCSGRGEDKTLHESEANIFAAELLAPKEFLKEDFRTIKKIPDLAKRYQMSKQAITIRLMESGLLR